MTATMVDSTAENLYQDIADQIKTITSSPGDFLTAQPEKYKQIQDVLQNIYKLAMGNYGSAKNRITCINPDILPELILEDMDEEQIWQQLEIRNDIVLAQLLRETAKLMAIPETNYEIRLNEDNSEDENDDIEQNNADTGTLSQDVFGSAVDENSEEDELDLGQGTNSGRSSKRKKKVRSSIVDDKFFKLNEMKEFLEAEEAKEMRKQKGKPDLQDIDGIDYFSENLGTGNDNKDENPNYKDFFDEDEDSDSNDANKVDYFADKQDKLGDESNLEENEVESDEEDEDDDEGDGDKEEEADEDDKEEEDEDDEDDIQDDLPQSSKRNENLGNMETASDSDSDSDSDNDNKEEQPQSTFELRQARLQQRIHDHEEERLGEKPWQLKGEILAGNRPQNSLLEEILEFESTVRPAPIITEETTNRLEDIIKQRIKDKAFDDVELKVRPTRTPQEFRKQLVLDQEKSKESLAQIYEKEYQKELDKIDPNRDENGTEAEPKEHEEIRRLLRSLFIKLDALSNFHYTPKPALPEPKIITNTPAIAMEEVMPVAVSDAKLLAPEEVYRGPKHELLGKTERDRTDKNRERRKKKQKQRAIHKALEAKDLKRQKMGIPLTKKEEGAKLMKSLTKHRNVEKVSINNDQKSMKSSKAFFNKLQETSATASNSKTEKMAKRKLDSKSISAKKLKL